MSPTDKQFHSPPPQQPPSQNLAFLYQRHRSRVHDLHARANNTGYQQDADRREAAAGGYGGRMYAGRDLRPSNRYGNAPHPVASPLLNALSPVSNAAQYTSDWAKSLPPFQTSSGQAAPLADSPPTGAIPIRRSRDTTSTSRSPSLKPHSQPNNNTGIQSLSPRNRERRASVFSQIDPAAAYRNAPPLPHEDQSHFHAGGLLDFDSIGVTQQPQDLDNALMPGEKGFFCGWDTLGDCGHEPSDQAENIIITGYEGGLRVYRVSKKDNPVPIGFVKGLKGAVHDAKILPWAMSDDPAPAGRPYIAIVLHGPVIEDAGEVQQNSSDESAAPSTEDDNSPAPSERQPYYQERPDDATPIRSYRTTVEIHSLQSGHHVQTLFTSPSVPFNMPRSPIEDFTVPAPVGDLKVDAKGKFLTVASGESGEVFVFSPVMAKSHTDTETAAELEMKCIAKLWTTALQRPMRSRPPSSSDSRRASEPLGEVFEPQPGLPLFSLSDRWLALVHPSGTAVQSMNGVAYISNSGRKPPGISNNVAPSIPGPTCDTDEADSQDFMDRMSRQLTQGAVVVGSLLQKKGLETWNNYWNGKNNTPGNRSSYPPTGVDGGHVPSNFPPTHGYNSPPPQEGPQTAQIALYDLQRFLDAEEGQLKVKNILNPFASFELTAGCSLLSWAPDGFHLLTVGRKGDEQTVWDLMSMRDNRPKYPTAIPASVAKASKTTSSRPMVRNIFKVTRNTIAQIIDVVWEVPPQGTNCQRFALLSATGTTHVHEIPGSKYNWPPPRKAAKPGASKQRSRSEDPNAGQTSPGGGYGDMARNAFTGASTFVNQMRQRSASGQYSFAGLAMTPANFSRKALKTGVRQGTKALVNGAVSVIQIQDNKLHVQSQLDTLRPRSIRLLSGKSSQGGWLGVVTAGRVTLYPVKTITRSSNGKSGPMEYHSRIAKTGFEYPLPSIPADQFAPAVRTILENRRGAANNPEDAVASGHWALRAPPAGHQRQQASSSGSRDWRSMIATDSNPAYQPFHTDRRVTLAAFPEPEEQAPRVPDRSASADDFEQYDADRQVYDEEVLGPHIQHTHHINDTSAWMFGEPVDAKIIKEGSGGVGANAGLGTGGDGTGEEETDYELNVVQMGGADEGTLFLNTVPRTSRGEEDFFEEGAEIVDFI